MNVYTNSNGVLSGKNVVLTGKTINSVSYNPNFDKVYIGNDLSDDNQYLQYANVGNNITDLSVGNIN